MCIRDSFPREEAIETEKEIARLRGLPATMHEAVKESSQEAVADAQTLRSGKAPVQGTEEGKP